MNSGDSDPPVACERKALGKAQRQRQKELLEIVRGKEVAEWVNLERRCCAFAKFGILADGDETVRVRLSGGPGAKDVLAAEVGLGTALRNGNDRPQT